MDVEIDDILKIRLKNIYDVEDDLSNLYDILNQYKALHKIHNKILDTRGKFIKDALNEQALGFGYFDEARINLKTIVTMLEHYTKHQRSIQFKKIRNKEPKAITEREVNILVDAEPIVMKYLKMHREANEIYEKFISISESFRQRGFVLNNLTKIYESELDKVIL